MSNPQKPQEFANIIGDTQQRGDANVTGLGPAPRTDIPVGIAPPSPLQVQSVFDTRPLSAYDACIPMPVSIQFLAEGALGRSASVALPAGFTFVLRRIEMECAPGFLGSTAFQGGNGAYLQFFILRDGSTIPNNELQLNTLTQYTWTTHQVYGFWQSIGLRINLPPLNAPVTGTDYDFFFHFHGTLIPTRSLPPTEEVGSDPMLVRLYNTPRAR